MEALTVKMTGNGPMLMHSDRLVDALAPETKAHKKLTSDRSLKKTDDGLIQIARSGFINACYWDKDRHIVLPTWNIKKSIIEGARLSKGGKKIERGVIMMEEIVPFDFPGSPMTPEELWDNGNFCDGRSVVVSGRKITAYRPRFQEWSVTVDLLFDPKIIDKADLMDYWKTAGLMIGIGDFRPRYGRYTVEKI